MPGMQNSIRQGVLPQRQAARARDPMNWAFLAALVLLFWLPELVLHMDWARFWIQFATQVFIWSLFAVSFNLLMGYAGMISFAAIAPSTRSQKPPTPTRDTKASGETDASDAHALGASARRFGCYPVPA